MKPNVLLHSIALIILSSAIHAQLPGELMFDKDGRPFSIPPFHDYNLKLEPSVGVAFTKADDQKPSPFIANQGVASSASLANLPINLHVLSSAYAPFFNPYMPMMARVSPTALDFSETEVMMLGDNMALLTYGRKSTWPLFGGQADLTTQLAWQHNNLTIAGGIFAGNYYTPLNLSPELMGGVALDARYQFSDKVAMRGWGRYTLYSGDGAMNPWVQQGAFFNHSSLGGALEYMFNENFGMGGGVEYRFNYFKGRLEPHPVVYPIFKSGHFSIGVR
ncbi:MAG: hypothetical protein LBD28_05535 [Tannerellaceae bacterium]|jgi:hypothetical protein|nr:hypothetical protein [Tannerellaceae bacterium]